MWTRQGSLIVSLHLCSLSPWPRTECTTGRAGTIWPGHSGLPLQPIRKTGARRELGNPTQPQVSASLLGVLRKHSPPVPRPRRQASLALAPTHDGNLATKNQPPIPGTPFAGMSGGGVGERDDCLCVHDGMAGEGRWGECRQGTGSLRRYRTGKGSLHTHTRPVPIQYSSAPTAWCGIKSRFPTTLPVQSLLVISEP